MKGSVMILWVCWLVGGLGACRPQEKARPVAAELADTVALAGQVDSAHQVSQDGLDYLPLQTGTYQQLPAAVTEILNQQYPGWALPELPADFLKQADRQAQGPYFVQADFDANGLEDFAVQFQFRDSTLVAAYLQQRRQPPLKFILARQPLVRVKGEKKSPLVVSQDSTLPAGTPDSRISYSQQGIAIVMPQSSRVFVYKGKGFSPVAAKSQEGG
jgi:hypothetical protein